jgi:Protein of unknown function (DUF2851)
MNEKLLQFIWQFQYFHKNELQTQQHERLQIVQPGIANHNQGPDFLQASIIINETKWAGNIELHVLTSHWQQHQHQHDSNYKNVILHVVWQNDLPVLPGDIPLLVLENRVSNFMLQTYQQFMRNSNFIACEQLLPNVPAITWLSWKERAVAERLEQRCNHIFLLLKETNYNWEEVFWWMIARNFGGKVNGNVFELMARTLPHTTLAKYRNQVHQLEAMMLGQLGMLQNTTEDYMVMLQKEYSFLLHKHKFAKVNEAVQHLRMRPAAFPEIRAAQLAMLTHQSLHLFAAVKSAVKIFELKQLLDVAANDYWHYHYRIGEPTSYKVKNTGTVMIENIIINTVVPMVFAYGHYYKQNTFKDKAFEWLRNLSAEENSITKKWKLAGVPNKNALDSQALLQIKKYYCDENQCLHCAIGNAILKKG